MILLVIHAGAVTGEAVALIGDVVGSRSRHDRFRLQEQLLGALAEVEGDLPAVQALAATVGDEFQGVYPDIGSAVRAALLLRLALLPEVDVRFGLGSGTFSVFDAQSRPISQDGPAWWAAREAIVTTKERAQRPRSRSARIWYVAAPESAGTRACTGSVNAYLACCDELLGRMTPRELRLTRGLLRGAAQLELAEQEKVVPSAVSQALSRSGAHTIIESLDLLAQDADA